MMRASARCALAARGAAAVARSAAPSWAPLSRPMQQKRFAGFKEWREQMRTNTQEAMNASMWVDEHGSPYAVLGLPEGASQEAVKEAYRGLSMKVHPDKGGTIEEFQKVQYAYNMISKNLYRPSDNGANGAKIQGRRTLILLALIGLVALVAAYALIFLPLRYVLRRVGVLSPAEEAKGAVADVTLKDEIKELTNQVNKLQESLDEVREALRKSPQGGRFSKRLQ